MLMIADGVRDDERIRALRETAAATGLAVQTVPRPALDAATAGANHQGVGLDAAPYAYVDAEDLLELPGTILVLDHLQDPQNVGTLLRAGEAAGVAGVVIPQDRAAGISPAVVNGSAGAVELIPVAQVPNLARFVERAKEAGRWAIGLEDDERSVDLFRDDLPLPAVLIVGAEGPGIGPNLRRHCDVLVKIPMSGRVASLNVSTAGSIALFELVRRAGLSDTDE
jgi:23S rRNA (guanosine2251-2'-O)-methyltransferase